MGTGQPGRTSATHRSDLYSRRLAVSSEMGTCMTQCVGLDSYLKVLLELAQRGLRLSVPWAKR